MQRYQQPALIAALDGFEQFRNQPNVTRRLEVGNHSPCEVEQVAAREFGLRGLRDMTCSP
jgi:hypothetical protein